MVLRKLPEKKYWCSICDNEYATEEISNNGSLKLFWACGENDSELCLCPACRVELTSLLLRAAE